MPLHHRRTTRRITAAIAAVGLAATLSACDSGDSSGSGGTSTSTRKQRGSTTTSSTRADGSSTTTTTAPASGTTVPTGTTPTSAPPTTGTCGNQAAAITAAVTGGDLGPVPVENSTITDCRLAPSQPIWGAVVLTPNPGQTVDRLTVVVQRLGSIWTVHSYGTGATGCDAPPPVPTELQLGC